MAKIVVLDAEEILDSRGRPTVRAICRVDDGPLVSASVPSGASTGSAEALELRDGDKRRYNGLGCRKAVANVRGAIRKAILGRDFSSIAALDAALLSLDGTPDKRRLGANAVLAVSLVFARASAAAEGIPLFEKLAPIARNRAPRLPRLTINLFSGGRHAGGQVEFQDVLVVPSRARTIDEGLATVFAVYQSAAKLVNRKYGMRALKADEGGLAPNFPSCEAMLADAVTAITDAGLKPGRDVHLAVDVASTHFHQSGRYRFDGKDLRALELIAVLRRLAAKYPIVSIEDGLSEDDWRHWPKLRAILGERVLTLGDDLLCTNPSRIRRAIRTRAANALLLKVNQIGTLTEAAKACLLARDAGWKVTVSARSGETEDDWLADLAVAWRADQIKVGSICQSERLAKYNRLLAIERQHHLGLAGWPSHRDR